MTKENGSNNNDSENAKAPDKNQDSKSQTDGKKTEGQEDDKKISTQIPKKRFDEVNEKYKTASKELEAFKSAKTEAETKKLEEDGKFQELLTLKDKENEELKSSLETEKKNNKLSGLKNKSLNLLNKAGIIDGDDGIKFLNLNDVMDNDNPDEILDNMVKSLKEDKSYLFGSTDKKRNIDENGMPGGGGEGGDNKNKSGDAFTNAFNKVYS